MSDVLIPVVIEFHKRNLWLFKLVHYNQTRAEPELQALFFQACRTSPYVIRCGVIGYVYRASTDLMPVLVISGNIQFNLESTRVPTSPVCLGFLTGHFVVLIQFLDVFQAEEFRVNFILNHDVRILVSPLGLYDVLFPIS